MDAAGAVHKVAGASATPVVASMKVAKRKIAETSLTDQHDDAKKKKFQKSSGSAAGSQITAKAPVAVFDSKSFLSRGWTQPGRDAIQRGMHCLRTAFDCCVKTGGPLVDDKGAVRDDMGGKTWAWIVQRAPSAMENKYGKNISGNVRATSFSASVHGVLVRCQKDLREGQAKSFRKLLMDIQRFGDELLIG